MRFVKMHGAGNDFVVIDGAKENIAEEQLAAVARGACDRRLGIGGDGIILVLPSRVANFRMRMFNPDGSEAEMCGNGIRCFAKYLFDRKMHQDVVMTVETLGGVKTLKLNAAGGKIQTVRVDMGEPKLLRSEIPMRGDNTKVVAEPLKVAGKKLEITCVSMGNPHCVTFVPHVSDYPVEKIGPDVENHPSFPQRTNVEFVELINQQEIRMRVWERGAGETLACGTGACAAAVASMLNDKVSRKVTVHLPGGDLFIEWLGDNKVFMTGPAEEVFEGKVGTGEMRKWLA
ncbi:MAG: diaminopimelate epimerase [Armatimonadetes bacterium]|nr:diaminopimelate epimerase [Armatimonadota bacterium]